MILKKTVNKNHPQTNILGQFIINAKKMCKNNNKAACQHNSYETTEQNFMKLGR
jgi:hypothetical protein